MCNPAAYGSADTAMPEEALAQREATRTGVGVSQQEVVSRHPGAEDAEAAEEGNLKGSSPVGKTGQIPDSASIGMGQMPEKLVDFQHVPKGQHTGKHSSAAGQGTLDCAAPGGQQISAEFKLVHDQSWGVVMPSKGQQSAAFKVCAPAQFYEIPTSPQLGPVVMTMDCVHNLLQACLQLWLELLDRCLCLLCACLAPPSAQSH